MAVADERSHLRRRRLLFTLGAPLVGLGLCELVLRWLLFSGSSLAMSWGSSFRDPSLYVASVNTDEYHKLKVRLLPELDLVKAKPHPELGWVGRWLDPETLRQVDEPRLGQRRPVLLFGSSYAACSQSRAKCFQQYLRESELGNRLALLNFAVGSYGPDQMLMLMERVLDRFVERNPIVVLALVEDADPRRTTHSLFNLPKPRFVQGTGGFEVVHPDVLNRDEYVARHGIGIRSYLWRYLRYGVELFPGVREERLELAGRMREERTVLMQHCMTEFSAHARAAGLDHFVLLFHTQSSYATGEREPSPECDELKAFLERASIPCFDSQATVERHLAATGASIEDLTVNDHPNERGTEVLFGALLEGLAPFVLAR